MRAAVDPAQFDALDPIPIVRLGDRIVITDGHTRAFAAWSGGRTEVSAVWDEDDLDGEAYEICVAWCEQEGIYTIADLQGRVVDPEAYQALWLDRCAVMHRALEKERQRE